MRSTVYVIHGCYIHLSPLSQPLGLFARTKEGNIYLLVGTDSFTARVYCDSASFHSDFLAISVYRAELRRKTTFAARNTLAAGYGLYDAISSPAT
jgi:hypothetical protein